VNTFLEKAKVALTHSQPVLTLVAVALTTVFSMPQVLEFDVDFISLLATIPFAATAVLYFTRNDRFAAISLVIGVVLAFVARGGVPADMWGLIAIWVLTLTLMLLPHEHADLRDGAIVKTAIALGVWLLIAMLSVLIRNDSDSTSLGAQSFFETGNLLNLLRAAIVVVALLALLGRPVVSFAIAVFLQVEQFVQTVAVQFQDNFDGFPFWLRVEQIVLSLTMWFTLAVVAAVLMKPEAKTQDTTQQPPSW
jgi:hypothetical protein